MGEVKPIKISLIAAVAENNVIGLDGGMPWRLPSDMAFFKATTMGKPIVMGRKQFETVGRALPGRTNIVVSRQKNYQPDGVLVINDFDAAIEHARTIAEAEGVDEVMIIGGGEIYALSLPIADRLYISHVAASPEGDVVFPDIDAKVWEIAETPAHTPLDKDSAVYGIRVYRRRSDAMH